MSIKPDGTWVITVHLTFKPGKDDLLIELIQSTPSGYLASTIKEAMRNGVSQVFGPTTFEEGDEDLHIKLSDFGIEI